VSRLDAIAARFEVGEVLEEGATWTTCRATQRADRKAVLVRVVEDERLAQDANAQRFLADAKVAGALEHPALVPQCDAAVEGGRAWTACGPAHGITLRELVSLGAVDPAHVVRAGEAVAAALDLAHARGVLHRDLRLENVLQVAPGAYRLSGFCTGRWMMAGSRRADGTQTAGVAATLAPELLIGGVPTVASEVYALGLLLYELATGAPAFEPTDPEAVLERATTGTAMPIRPSLRRHELPPELDEVLLRALARDPSSRFLTAQQMKEALAACPGGSGLAPAPNRRRTIPTWAEMLSATKTPLQKAKRAALFFVPVAALGVLIAVGLKPREAAPPVDLMQRALAEVQRRPGDVGLRVQFAEQLERERRLDDARKLYEDAKRVDAKATRALAGLARIAAKEGRADDARKQYRATLELDPKAWFAALELSRLLSLEQRFHEAKVVVQQALAASPGQPDLTEELQRLETNR
jgi:hypothetical protein